MQVYRSHLLVNPFIERPQLLMDQLVLSLRLLLDGRVFQIQTELLKLVEEVPLEADVFLFELLVQVFAEFQFFRPFRLKSLR